MNPRLPPLAWFRAFEAAARCLSFTGAAAELGLTQSAISQHVRSLELRFGVALFERKPRGLALSDEGRRMLPEVSRAIGVLAAVSSSYEHRPVGQAITVATSVSFAQWYLAPGLADFRAAHPDLSVRLINTTWPDEYHRPIADVEIRFGAEAFVGKSATRLEPDGLIVVAAPSLKATPDSLGQHPLIEAVGTSDGWSYWANTTEIEMPKKPDLLVDSHGLAVDLSRQGAGIALTSALIAAPCLAQGTLQQLDLPSVPANDGYFLAVGAAEKEDALIFASWIQDIVASKAALPKPAAAPSKSGR